MSTSLNSIAATLFEDYIKPALPRKPDDRQSNLIMKSIVIILGFASTAMVFVIAKMGTIMQTAITLGGITTGVLTFIFSFGMFIPWANAKGAIAGALSGLTVVIWIALNAQFAAVRGDINYPGKMTTIENCPLNTTLPEGLNTTRFGNPGYGTVVEFADSVPLIYRISYLYLAPCGLIVSSVVGLIVSLLTGGQDLSELDPELIVPQLRWLLPQYKMKVSTINLDLYTPIALNETNGGIEQKVKKSPSVK